MSVNSSLGREIRTSRMFRHSDRRLFVVPLDHSVSDGPFNGNHDIGRLVDLFATVGADAVVLHKGTARHLEGHLFARMSLILHLSASTRHAPDPDRKYLVAGVEEALRLGADAVSVHVNLGSASEHVQLADLAAVTDACDRWGVPLLAMMYPRGPKIDDPARPDLVAHAATLAADLGADLVKVPYPGSVEELTHVVAVCPIPVLVAGGPRLNSETDVLKRAADVVDAGAVGIAMGRNVFGANRPEITAKALCDVIHHRAAEFSGVPI